jgi:hypothetical protein
MKPTVQIRWIGDVDGPGLTANLVHEPVAMNPEPALDFGLAGAS